MSTSATSTEATLAERAQKAAGDYIDNLEQHTSRFGPPLSHTQKEELGLKAQFERADSLASAVLMQAKGRDSQTSSTMTASKNKYSSLGRSSQA